MNHVLLADRLPENLGLTTRDIYLEMKRVMPMEKIVVTALRLDPTITQAEVEQRADALAQWLATIPQALKEGRWFQMIETVDLAWHAFILHTRDYMDFCQHFYGGFLHHSPPLNYDEDRREYAEYTLGKLQGAFGEGLNPLLGDLAADVKCCFRYQVT